MSEEKKTDAAKSKNSKSEKLPENAVEKQVDTSSPESEKQGPVTSEQAVAPPINTKAVPESQGESQADAADNKEPEGGGQAVPASPGAREVEIYPLRSYLDAGEIKRRGGPGYTVPRRHAEALIAQGLASPEKPKA